MSGPIKSQITFNLSSMVNVKPSDYKCPVDSKQSAEVNVLVLTAGHQRVKELIRVVHTCLDDVRQALGAWTDLCRKMSADERALEDQLCAQYKQAHNLDDELIKGMGILSELNDIARDIDRDLSLQKAKIPRVPQQAAGPAPAAAASKDPDLRPLELPEFFGKVGESWEEFKDTFYDRVVNRFPTESTRMAYLQMYVKQPAARVIAGLKKDEFALAIKALEDKYGDKNTYIRELHRQLADIKPCHDSKGLANFKLELDRLIRQLNTQGEDVNGPQTFIALERKIPDFAIRKVLERQSSKVGWTTDDFCKTIGDIVKNEENFANIRASKEVPNHSNERNTTRKQLTDSRTHNHKKITEANVFAINEQKKRAQAKPAKKKVDSTPKGKKPYPCTFCESTDHFRSQCQVYDTLEKRIDRLKALRLCFNCFTPGHNTVRCQKEKVACRRCKGPHNVALCGKTDVTETSKQPEASKGRKFPKYVQNVTSGMVKAEVDGHSSERKALLMIIKTNYLIQFELSKGRKQRCC